MQLNKNVTYYIREPQLQQISKFPGFFSEQRLQKISAIEQVFQTTANTQDHTTPQHLITATQGPQPLNLVIIN